MKRPFLLCSLLAIAGCDQPPEDGIVIDQAHTTSITAKTKVSAAYFSVHNHASDPLLLIGAASTCFGGIEIHETSVDKQGTFSMRRLDSVTVPGNSTVNWQRGGKHLMLFRRSCELKDGDSVDIQLKFKGDVSRVQTFRVGPPDTQGK